MNFNLVVIFVICVVFLIPLVNLINKAFHKPRKLGSTFRNGWKVIGILTGINTGEKYVVESWTDPAKIDPKVYYQIYQYYDDPARVTPIEFKSGLNVGDKIKIDGKDDDFFYSKVCY